MLSQFPRPTIFAHRGASAYAPENTLSAFELAIEHGADAIEFDVQLSADDQVVVIHDSTVDRTTDGSGRVRQLTLSVLKQLDAGAYFDSAFLDERIPTLDEVFDAVGNRILMNIELKPEFSSRYLLPEKVAQAIRRHHMQARVLFSSFDPLILRQMKRFLPEIPCGLLALPGFGGWLMRSLVGKIYRFEALHPHYSSVSARMVQEIHHSGQRLHVYTVNQPEQMARLFRLGVDGIFTDDPNLAVKTLREIHLLSEN